MNRYVLTDVHGKVVEVVLCKSRLTDREVRDAACQQLRKFFRDTPTNRLEIEVASITREDVK